MRTGEMAGRITGYIRGLLAIVLAVGIVFSANSRSVTHDLAELAKIVSDHHAEIKEHGHAHEDIADLVHAFRGHHHEIIDHDHNIAFFPPRESITTPLLTGTALASADFGKPDLIGYGLDRPPHV